MRHGVSLQDSGIRKQRHERSNGPGSSNLHHTREQKIRLKNSVSSALRRRQHGDQRTEEAQVISHGQRIARLGMTLPSHYRVSCIRTAERFRPVSLTGTAVVDERETTSGAAPSNCRAGPAARRKRSTHTRVKTH